MILQDVTDKIESLNEENTLLYFITRKKKEKTKMSAKMLDKYDFLTYQIDIDSEIRKHLHSTVKQQFNFFNKRKDEVLDYDVVLDDTHSLLTYSIKNKVMSFKDVITNQITNNPPKIQSLDEILQDEELWSYAIGLYNDKNEWIYTFKKVMNGKVAVNQDNSNKHNSIKKSIRTIFNSDSEKLELIEGETIFLDKQVDCFYYAEIFYIFRKTKFEQIVGLVEEYKEQSKSVVDELKATRMIEGLDLIAEQIENKPAIHRKLVRLQRIGNYRELSDAVIHKMKEICSKYGDTLKINNGKIQIEDEKDIDLALKMLSDYYKTGEVSGKAYGTYAGKQLNVG